MAYQKKVQTYEENKYVKETMLDIEQLPIAHSKERGITKETCERFNVRMSISETDGKTPTAYFFPYYDSKGKLSGWKTGKVWKWVIYWSATVTSLWLEE